MTSAPQPEEPELPCFLPDDYDNTDLELPRIMCCCGMLMHKDKVLDVGSASMLDGGASRSSSAADTP
jgi:hypothetical protein